MTAQRSSSVRDILLERFAEGVAHLDTRYRSGIHLFIGTQHGKSFERSIFVASCVTPRSML